MSLATDHLREFLDQLRARVRRDLPGVLGDAVHEILDDAGEALCEVAAELRELQGENEDMRAALEDAGVEIDEVLREAAN